MSDKPKKLDHMGLMERLELARKTRRPFERDWFLNLAYVEGEQHVAWAYDPSNRIIEKELAENEIWPIHNIFVKISRVERAKLLKNKPTPTALPATDDEDDYYAARIVDSYFRYLQDLWNYEARMRQAAPWLVNTGNVFFKWYWANGAQMAVIPPFDVYPDPYAKTFHDCRWVIHSQFMDEDTAREVYKDIKDADIDAIRTTVNADSLNKVEKRLFQVYGLEMGHDLPGVIVHEYWERPSASNKDGRFVVFTEHGIIVDKKFPYAHGKLPFTHAGHIQRANSKWCAAPLSHVRDVQDEINRAEKQIVENRNISNGIWFVPESVEMDTEISAEPRQVIKWTGPPNLDPRNWFVQPQGMANWVGGEPDRLKETAQDLVSQHEVSNAGVPGRVEAGQAISLLQESDDSVMTDVIHSMNEAIADGFLMCAELHREFGPAEMLVTVYDKDGIVETETLMKDMIPLDLRVKSQITTGLPQTIAGKWDRVLNLVQYQIIDPQRAIELLDLSSENPSLTPYVLDKKNAYRENKQMLAGEVFRPKMFENHEVHIAEHERVCKTEEWRQAVADDPEIELTFGFHIEEHKKLQAQVDQEMAAREAATQAGLSQNEPAPGGEAPPPMPQPPAPADNGSPAPVSS